MAPYVPQSSDTSRATEEFLFAAYRRMSPTEKLRRIGALGRLAESVALADIRARHPEASAREVRLRLAARQLDRETMIRAFGWDPAEKGT